MSKHETVNSIGVIVAIVAAFSSLYQQYKSTPDDLKLTTNGRIISDSIVSMIDHGGPNKEADGLDPVIGPIPWKVLAYNPTARPVTVTDFKMSYLSPAGRQIDYSAMNKTMSTAQDSTQSVPLPDQISPGEAKAYVLSVYMPIHPTDQQRAACLGKELSLLELERCFYQHGTDLFGNRVEKTVEQFPGMFTIGYSGTLSGPQFIMEMKTGDGSSEIINLSYY